MPLKWVEDREIYPIQTGVVYNMFFAFRGVADAVLGAESGFY